MTREENAPNAPSKGVNQSTPTPLALSAIKCKAAAHGISIYRNTKGFAVARWGYVKDFANLAEVKSFLKTMGIQ